MKNLFNPIPIHFSTRYKPSLSSSNITFANNEIHLWLLEIDKIKNSSLDIFLILSNNEIEKAKKFRTLAQQRLFCFSHGYLRLILSSYLVCPPHEVRFKYGQYGKPYLKEELQKNNKIIQFNMSHSHHAVLYGVCLNSEIGVDLEYIQQGLSWQEITTLTLTQKEKEKILLLTTTLAQVKEFYKVWTCKEAFLKSFGIGINISPSSIETNYQSNQSYMNGIFKQC